MVSEVLLARASKDVDGVVVEVSVLLPTQPTPTVAALPASHVVAS